MTFARRAHAPMRSRAATLIGVAAAAGAFGAAAMMSAATAPTARADDTAAIEAAISDQLGFGQTAFSNAATDFETSNYIGGVEAYFEGVDDDTIGVPDIAYVGGVDELTNESYNIANGQFDLNGADWPTSFSEGVTDAEQISTEAQTLFSSVPTELSSGEYGDAALYGAVGALLVDIIPQYLTIGGLESLGL